MLWVVTLCGFGGACCFHLQDLLAVSQRTTRYSEQCYYDETVHVESLCFKVTVERLIHLFLLAVPNGIIHMTLLHPFMNQT